MTEIFTILKQKIEEDGPISIADYMSICMTHPQHGYYMTKDPLGQRGDFITAPEMTQIFGELIGIWLISTWRQMKSPDGFNLIELGGGRGTLMKDALRACEGDEDFMKSFNLHMVEVSPVLREMQAKNLARFSPRFHENYDDIPKKPFILVANEFFDVLPLQQFIKHNGQWHERRICISENKLAFSNQPLTEKEMNLIPNKVLNSEDGTVYEYRPAARDLIKKIGHDLTQNVGSALIIDYGHESSGVGDTFQAIYQHEMVPVTEHPGEADLTAHVDFELLAKAAGDVIPYMSTQARFLSQLGIGLRTDILAKAVEGEARMAVRSATDRLIGKDQMGHLFKAFCINNKSLSVPIGFR